MRLAGSSPRPAPHEGQAALAALASLASRRERELASVARPSAPEAGAAGRGGRSCAIRRRSGGIARHAADAARPAAGGRAARPTPASSRRRAARRARRRRRRRRRPPGRRLGRDADRHQPEGAHEGRAEERRGAAARPRGGRPAAAETAPAIDYGRRPAAGPRPRRADERARRQRRPHRAARSLRRRPRRVGRAAGRRRHPGPDPSSVRERLRRRPRAAGRRRSRARRGRAPAPWRSSGTGRSHRRVRAASKASTATTSSIAGRGARDVGRHAGDARRRGRPSCERRFDEACRAAEKRHERRVGCAKQLGRAPADARARDRSAGRPPRTTPTSAASGTRCASSGRPSPATSRSTPS